MGIFYDICNEIASASAMGSILVSTTQNVKCVLGTVIGLNNLHLPILGEHVANCVYSLLFRR